MSSCGCASLLSSVLFYTPILDGEKKQKDEDDAKKIQGKKKLEHAGKCSKIMVIRGGGQYKCEKLGVKAALICQNANLTVMIMSHFKKSLSLVVIFISSWPHSRHTVSHKQEQASQASLKSAG